MNRDTTFVGSNPNIGDYNLLVLLGHDGAKALRDRSLSFLTSVCDKIGMEISKIRNFRDRSEGEWEMSPNDVRCVGTGYRGHPYVFNLILSEALANKLVSGDRDAKVEIGLVLREQTRILVEKFGINLDDPTPYKNGPDSSTPQTETVVLGPVIASAPAPLCETPTPAPEADPAPKAKAKHKTPAKPRKKKGEGETKPEETKTE